MMVIFKMTVCSTGAETHFLKQESAIQAAKRALRADGFGNSFTECGTDDLIRVDGYSDEDVHACTIVPINVEVI